MPTVLLPGIVAILADSELVFLAMSSDKLIIFETLTPAAGSNSFKVTTGPWLTFLILPLTPKSNRIFSKNSGSCVSLFSWFSLSFLEGVFNKLKSGNLNLVIFLLLFSALINGKSTYYGISDLKNKESNRITEMQKILKQIGIKTNYSKDKLVINGKRL